MPTQPPNRIAKCKYAKPTQAPNRIAKYWCAEKVPLTSRIQTELEPQEPQTETETNTGSKMARMHPNCTLKFIRPKCLMHKG